MSSTPFTILVRMPNWLGDCVMAMPALRHLSDALPLASLHLAGRENFRELFLAQPGVTGFVAAPASGAAKLLAGLAGARGAIRAADVPGRVDLGLLFTNSLSTAVWLWRCGARMRIGYNRDARRLFLTHPVPCGGVESSWHFVRYYLWLAKYAEAVAEETDIVAGRQVEPLTRYLTPTLRVGEESRRRAAELLRARGVDGPYAVLAPASAYGPVKDWPPGHYRTLADAVNVDLRMPVVVTGGAAQRTVCEEIAHGRKAAVNLAGETDLDAFAGVIAGASLFVGGDSGGAHVAAALGVPTAVVFGVTNPARTRPIGPRVRMLGAGEDRDVKLSTPEAREAAKRALEAIRPETVLAAVAELVSRPDGETPCPLP